MDRTSARRKRAKKSFDANRRRPNVSSEVSCKFLACILRSGAGDVGVKAGESTGEGDQQGEEELECFDAMQTDSTEARR